MKHSPGRSWQVLCYHCGLERTTIGVSVYDSGQRQDLQVQQKYLIALLYNLLQCLQQEKQLYKKEMLQLFEFY